MTALKVHGTDLSKWNPDPDFKKAKATGLIWCYHKATEGSTLIDSKYISRRTAARAAGVTFGAYHFARPDGRDAVVEARHFIKIADPRAGDLVPVLDYEDAKIGWGTAAMTWCKQFMTEVERLLEERGLQGKPILYAPQSIKWTREQFPYLRWVPRYNRDNRRPSSPWDIHQFSGGSVTPGTPSSYNGLGAVDLNNMRDGLSLQSIQLLRKSTKPTTGTPVKNTPKAPTAKTKQVTLRVGTANIAFNLTPRQAAEDARKIDKNTDLVAFQELAPPANWEAVMDALVSKDNSMPVKDGPNNWNRRSTSIAWNTKKLDLISEVRLGLPGFDPKGKVKNSKQRFVSKTTLNPYKSTLPWITVIDLHLINGAWGKDPQLNTFQRKGWWNEQWRFVHKQAAAELAKGRCVLLVGDWNRPIRDIPKPSFSGSQRWIIGSERTGGIDGAYLMLPKGVRAMKVTAPRTDEGHTDHPMHSVRLELRDDQ